VDRHPIFPTLSLGSQAYGDDALQLFRDRARDDQGFFPSLRLWLDLLTDPAASTPREHYFNVSERRIN
jgi:hypothetical protein